MYKKLTKCDFCKYRTKSGCTVTPDSWYCKDAKDEFYAYLAKIKAQNNKKTSGRQ